MPESILKKCQHIAKAITDELGGFGLFGVELMIHGDSVYFSEVSPRPHDTGMVTLLSQDLSEFALHLRAILGLPIPEIKQYGPTASSALLFSGKSTSMTFNNLESALNISGTSLRLFGKPEVNGKRRLGVALARGETIADAIEKAKIVNEAIIISDGIDRNDAIELVDYDPQWPKMAELEIKKLYEILFSEHIIDIQHVGSTAIPGMIAKPVIDIQIAVDSLDSIKPIAIEKLKTYGYEYWYENPDPERMFFVKGMPPFGEKRTHHVHIVEPSSRHWQGKIFFRDYLIAHPEAAREYAELKKKLAERYKYDRERYTDAKSQFVNEILKKS